MATKKGIVHHLLERAHSPDTAAQIFVDKIQYREQFLRPTTTADDERHPAGGDAATSSTAASAASFAAAAAAASETAAAGASGHNGREVRRRARRIKQEQRLQRRHGGHGQPKVKPKPLSARQRRAMGLYDLRREERNGKANGRIPSREPYATFLPLHRLWLGYMREVLSAQELRAGGTAAAAKLAASDFHGARVEVTRSACVGRVGICGIVVRDTRFVFEIVTPTNEVRMVPKEGTFFRVEIPVEEEGQEEEEQGTKDKAAEQAVNDNTPRLVIELVGSQFMHRATDRANRKFKQHFYKTL